MKLSKRETALLVKRLDVDCKMCELDADSCNRCPVTRFLDDLMAEARNLEALKCECGNELESTVEILGGKCEDCINTELDIERIIRREAVCGF